MMSVTVDMNQQITEPENSLCDSGNEKVYGDEDIVF